MSLIFKLFLALVSLALIVVIGSALLLYMPGFQKSLVLKTLQRQPDVTASVDTVRIRFSGAEIRGLKIVTGQESLNLDLLEAQFSLSGFFGEGVKVDSLRMEGFYLDIAASGGDLLLKGLGVSKSPTEEPTVASPQSTGKAGFPVEIGQVRLQGMVSLPSDLDVDFNLKLDNIRPDSAGALGLDIDVKATGPEAAFQMAEFRMTGALNQTAAGLFDRLEGEIKARLLENQSSDWLEASLQPRFTGSSSKFSAVIEALQLSKGATRLVEGELKADGTRREGESWLVGYSAELTSNLALVSRLSLVPMAEPLSSGELDCRLSGQFIEGLEATANGVLEVRDLRPANYTGRVLGLKFEPALVVGIGTGSIELKSSNLRLHGPETVTNGTLAGRLVQGSEGRERFNGTVDLDEFDPEEWEPLKAAFANADSAPSAPRDATADTTAPWSGFEGEAVVRIKRLHLGESFFEDMVSTVTIEDGKSLKLELAGRTGQTPLEAVATLGFNPASTSRPYSMEGALKVLGLDVTPFLKAPDSRRPVILEGVFDARGTFQSSAPNLAFLPDHLTGDFLLKSAKPGIFRPLGEKTSIATGISGLLGALGGSSNKVGWVQEVINQLKEIPYTQMSFHLGREDNLDLFLRELDLVSRETRIRGEGILEYREGASLMKLPMDLQFQLFAKGKLARALRDGNQLRSDQPDDMGFLAGPPLPLKGSLAQPESLLINLLMESGSQLLPGLLGPRN